MLTNRLVAPALAGFALVAAAQSQTVSLREDFAADPASRGWQTCGDAGLFSWDSTNRNLQVTWDSSQTNSYFYHPLGAVVTMDFDFTISFDLCVRDAAISGYGFELAVGLFSLADASQPAFCRGTGSDSPNLVEFDYFPDPANILWWGPSITAVMVDKVGIAATNWSSGGYLGLELPMNDTVTVTMAYTGADQTLRATITQNGALLAAIPTASLGSGFLGFALDSIAIESYSDFNGWGSILAHGTIGNVAVTASPPLGLITGAFDQAGAWQARFYSRSNWLYTLERTRDFGQWDPISTTRGTDADAALSDAYPPRDKAFYRVQASRP